MRPRQMRFWGFVVRFATNFPRGNPLEFNHGILVESGRRATSAFRKLHIRNHLLGSFGLLMTSPGNDASARLHKIYVARLGISPVAESPDNS
jgi:hypothetical protein